MIKKFNQFINEMHDSSYLSDECQMAFNKFVMENDLGENDYVDNLYSFMNSLKNSNDPNGWVDEVRSEYEINIDGTVYPD